MHTKMVVEKIHRQFSMLQKFSDINSDWQYSAFHNTQALSVVILLGSNRGREKLPQNS